MHTEKNLLNVNFHLCFVTAATVRHCAYHYIEVVVVDVSCWFFKTSLLGKQLKKQKNPLGPNQLVEGRIRLKYEALITILILFHFRIKHSLTVVIIESGAEEVDVQCSRSCTRTQIYHEQG